jgi:hypothetical protein
VLDVSLDLDATATTMTWAGRTAEGTRLPVELIEPVPDTWRAAARAVAAIGAPAGPATRQIAVATTMPSGPSAPTAPWMFAAIEAAHRAWDAAPGEADRLQFAIGSPSSLTAVIDPATDALRVARILRTLAEAAVDRPPVAEFENAEIPEATTHAWAREPGAPTARGVDSDASDGRWVWLLVLLLLGAEWIVRRRTTDESAGNADRVSEERGRHARVA